jgi:hypothetical protein
MSRFKSVVVNYVNFSNSIFLFICTFFLLITLGLAAAVFHLSAKGIQQEILVITNPIKNLWS